MTSKPDFFQPPRSAVWLVTLFTPADTAEAVLGDLLEEFSSVAAISGGVVAKRWYWRQSFNTLMDMAGAAFRSAPLLLVGVALGGLLLIGMASRTSQRLMEAFLDSHRIYESHPDAYLFWIKFPMELGRVLICTAVGMLVALAARGRELVATITLAAVQGVLFLTAVAAVIASGRSWGDWFFAMMPWNAFCALATVMGGALVRSRRSHPRTPHPV